MKVRSTEVQNNFGKYLKIASELERVTITRNGAEIADLVSCRNQFHSSEEAADYLYNRKNRLTYEEFLEMSEASDLHYEYIDGEVFLMASPTYNHQAIVAEIHVCFHNWLKGKKCRSLTSPFDVTLIKGKGSFNVVQPDILVLCDTDKINGKGRYTGVPTLVVEVLSGSGKGRDMVIKLDLYMQSGVREYWMVDPDKREVMLYSFDKRNIMDHAFFSRDQAVQSMVFPGLEIKLADIFSEMQDIQEETK